MKLRSLGVLLVVLAGAGVCARLGLWQLSRWEEKKALNAERRAALAAPPERAGPELPALEGVRGRRLEAAGRFDETRHFLLGGRTHRGAPGVEVVTPLLLAGDSAAILVNRGWLYSPDAATARPQDHPEPGERRVTGFVEVLPRGRGGMPPHVLRADSVTLYSVRALDGDSAAARLPYRVAPYTLRQLPGPGVPDRPVRSEPRALNEATHLSYAIQWFSFGAILLLGSSGLAWSRRRDKAAPDA